MRSLSGISTQRPGWDFTATGDGRTTHTEWFRSAIGQVSLSWDQLGAPLIVEMPKDKSATGKHEMFSSRQACAPQSMATALPDAHSRASSPA